MILESSENQFARPKKSRQNFRNFFENIPLEKILNPPLRGRNLVILLGILLDKMLIKKKKAAICSRLLIASVKKEEIFFVNFEFKKVNFHTLCIEITKGCFKRFLKY